jgi:hypothetical protein
MITTELAWTARRTFEMLTEAFETRSTSIVINKTWSLLSRFGRTLLSVNSIFYLRR